MGTDYEIFGEEMQYVEIELDPQEIVIAEAGSVSAGRHNIQMETIFGDGSEQQSGLFGKLKRWKKSPGESLFMTAFINQHVCLPYPGKFFRLIEFQGKFICQKLFYKGQAFLVGIEFSKN
jgi:uncharacterized protein (AIM24 family)